MSRRVSIAVFAAVCAAWAGSSLSGLALQAQGRQGAAGAQPQGGGPPSLRRLAPYDITGYWVAVVTDDWRYRMITPPKGNADFLPVTAAARKVMDAWDPATDEAAGEACKGYGAGGVMRQPGRLHITWVDDDTLKMDVSAGTQTRTFKFGPPPAPGAAAATTDAPSWQGTSTARWTFPLSRGRGPAVTAQLNVTTTGLRPGYVRKNGVPYGPSTVITENYVRLADEGDEFLVVTQTVDDPLYFAPPYVKTYEFKKERDGSKWAPTPCVAR